MKQKLYRAYHRLADTIPLTWQGALLLLAGGVILYYFGVKAEDWVLLMVGLFAVLMPILSGLTIGVSAFWIRRRLQQLNPEPNKQTLHTDTAQPAITDFKLPRIFLPFLDFAPTWESPHVDMTEIVQDIERTEQVLFARRGLHTEIIRRFTLSDLFGLAEVRWRMKEERRVEVWPRPHAHQAPFVRAFTEDTEHFVPSRPRRGDYVDTRAYIPGDPIRHIHWKLFARSQQPFVRIPEPSASFEHQIVAYLITDTDDDLAASAVRWDIEHRHFGEGWKLGTDHADQVATDLPTARRILAHSGSQPPAQGAHLASFLSSISFDSNQQRLLLYASGHLEHWLPQVLPVLKKHTAVISMIIASEQNLSLSRSNTAPTTSPSLRTTWAQQRWVDWFVHRSRVQQEPSPHWREQLQQLHSEGLQIQFVHTNPLSVKL